MSAKHIEFFEIFPWDKNFETGIELIDEQHKKLIYILNKLAAHLANRSDVFILNTIFDELIDYTDYHFESEEKIWSAHFKDDPWYAAHEKTHGSFIEKVIALKKEENEKPLDNVVQDIVSFLSHWLGYHILDTDKRMAKVVLALESGASMEEAKVSANEAMSGSMKVLIDTVLSMHDKLSIRTIDLMREKALRKQAEEALLASEERWKFVLEDSGENIWDWDIEQGIKYSSATDAPTFDLMLITGNKDETIDDERLNRVHPADIKRIRAELQDHLDGKTEFYINKYRILNKNAGWTWMLTRGKVINRDEHGTALRMVGTHSDITEREVGSLIFRHSSQAIIVTDVNNSIISVNPAFTQITGYSEADIFGKKPDFFLSDKHGDTFSDAIRTTLKLTGNWDGEIQGRRKSGELFPASVNITSITATEESVDHHIILFTDIGERKQIEKTLHQAKKMDAIGLLTGGISHDFNNLLAIILGNLELIEDQISPDDKIYDSLKDIEMAGERGAKLIKQLLNFSRRQPAQPIALNLNQIINKMDRLIARSVTPEIEVKMQFIDDLWLTEIDQSDFEDVVLNLVINARDAISSDGFLTFETSNCVLDTAFCEKNPGLQAGGYVKLSVSDSGMGMSPKQQEHIFEPFYTTKEQGKGTGLGLSMAYSFVERSKGYIDVFSKPGSGTTFTLYLPRTKMTEQAVEAGEMDTPSPVKSSKTILVVDDEPALLSLAKEVLSSLGYQVLTALEGCQALEIINNEADIDLLFSDVLMPGGINGYELAEQALAVRPGLKILLTSGHTRQQHTGGNETLPDFPLLDKPYKINEMLKQTQELLQD